MWEEACGRRCVGGGAWEVVCGRCVGGGAQVEARGRRRVGGGAQVEAQSLKEEVGPCAHLSRRRKGQETGPDERQEEWRDFRMGVRL